MLKIQQEMIAMQRETLTLLRQSLGLTRKDQVERAVMLLKELGPNTAAIARRMGIPRKTLDSWPEYREVRDGYAAHDEADRDNRRVRMQGRQPDEVEE